MLNNEPMLLMEVFLSKAADREQQRNLLMQYALTKIMAGCEELPVKTQQVAQAVAILLCVEETQFLPLLNKCSYVPSYQSAILELLLTADHYKGDHREALSVLNDVMYIFRCISGNNEALLRNGLAAPMTQTGIRMQKHFLGDKQDYLFSVSSPKIKKTESSQ